MTWFSSEDGGLLKSCTGAAGTPGRCVLSDCPRLSRVGPLPCCPRSCRAGRQVALTLVLFAPQMRGRFVCLQCRRAFSCSDSLVQHQVLKHGRVRVRRRRSSKDDEKQFVCDIADCGKRYFRMRHLFRHQAMKHPAVYYS